MKTIVVGVDGSACAQAALEFAIEEAALRGTALRVVCAWKIPAVFDPYTVYSTETFGGLREAAQTIVDKALAWAAELQPSVSCDGKVIGGQPADVILNEARGVALAVVGSRGRGGFASLLLGSVSQDVVHNAKCPVVVVRGAAR